MPGFRTTSLTSVMPLAFTDPIIQLLLVRGHLLRVGQDLALILGQLVQSIFLLKMTATGS